MLLELVGTVNYLCNWNWTSYWKKCSVDYLTEYEFRKYWVADVESTLPCFKTLSIVLGLFPGRGVVFEWPFIQSYTPFLGSNPNTIERVLDQGQVDSLSAT